MAQVCNFKRLSDIAMGDDEFAEELVRVFLDDAAIQIARLRDAVERADCKTTAEVAHRLKGAGGNVGVEILAELCQQLEQAARAESPDCFAKTFAEIDLELARARSLFAAEMGVG